MSVLKSVLVFSYQGPSAWSIRTALTECSGASIHRGHISAFDMEAFHVAVESVLPHSPEVGLEFCQGVINIVQAGPRVLNWKTAGVATIRLVILAMTSHADKASVQARGAVALGVLASNSPQNVASLVNFSGCTALYDASYNHITSWTVQQNVCWALHWIAISGAHGKAALLACPRVVCTATRAFHAHSNMGYAERLLLLLSL